jgi:hypothetical protein
VVFIQLTLTDTSICGATPPSLDQCYGRLARQFPWLGQTANPLLRGEPCWTPFPLQRNSQGRDRKQHYSLSGMELSLSNSSHPLSFLQKIGSSFAKGDHIGRGMSKDKKSPLAGAQSAQMQYMLLMEYKDISNEHIARLIFVLIPLVSSFILRSIPSAVVVVSHISDWIVINKSEHMPNRRNSHMT